MSVFVEVARGVLFTRALARVCTSHPQVRAVAEARADFARLVGEFISLLALVYLSENAGTHPWAPLLGALFAFLVPTVLLRDNAIGHMCDAFGLGGSVQSHVSVGIAGVVVVFAAYEGLLRLVDLAYHAA